MSRPPSTRTIFSRRRRGPSRWILAVTLLTFGSACGGSRPAPHYGSGALTPTPSDSVVAWQPLRAGERATVHLRDGRRLDGFLTGGADSSLFLATAVPSVMERGRVTVDTLDRSDIQLVSSHAAGENAVATFIAFPVGIVTGFIVALVMSVVLGVGD